MNPPPNSELLITAEQIQNRIDQLAAQINSDFVDLQPIVICVMNGGLVFCGQLLTRLQFSLQLDYAQLSRYRNETSAGDTQWIKSPSMDLNGRHLLVVDDILDEGGTLAQLADFCLGNGAASLKTAVLLDKQHNRKCRENMLPDYAGFTIEDRYVFGYGLDYRGYWRNLPAIYALSEGV